MTPKDVQVFIPGTCDFHLFGRRDIEDVIKLILNIFNLKSERLSWIIKVSPKYNHKGLYKREAEGDVMKEEKAV